MRFEPMEEGQANEAIWRCFLASIGSLWLDLTSEGWVAVASVSDPVPEHYAYRDTLRAWSVLNDSLTEINDVMTISEWQVDARYVTRRLLKAAGDLLKRIRDARVFYHMRDAHRAQKSWVSCFFDKPWLDEVRLQRLAEALRAAPEALRVDPAVWEGSDFWECFWLCATGKIAITDDEDAPDVPDAVAICAVRALVPMAQRLLQRPEHRAECERQITSLMFDNEGNAITACAPFQYALDQLGLRRLAETQLVHAELTHRQQRSEGEPLTLLSGNPYAPPPP